MHKILISLLALWATAANAAPACMSKQACINGDSGYCRYAYVKDSGERCWSTNLAFLKKVKAGKAGHSYVAKRKPMTTTETHTTSGPSSPREPASTSEPYHQTETTAPSEPFTGREPFQTSEPFSSREPERLSEPNGKREPVFASAPYEWREPVRWSEPAMAREPRSLSEPLSRREPKRMSGLEIGLLGVFSFASAFLGMSGARILAPVKWIPGGKVPPPPLDLANSIHRMVPALPEVSPVLLDLGQFVRESQRRIH